jgi:hypothetical protein
MQSVRMSLWTAGGLLAVGTIPALFRGGPFFGHAWSFLASKGGFFGVFGVF